MWTADEAWRAPVGDFPPPWASAWGDDPYGLWADLTVNGVTQRMRWIEPSGPEGFWMGASDSERDAIQDNQTRIYARKNECEPVVKQIAFGYWMAETPCTQSFWQAVMRNNPSEHHALPEAGSRPVEQVSWDDVADFLVTFSASQEWVTGLLLDLPSELEWEYAARAGTSTAYWWGDQAEASMGNWNLLRFGTSAVKSYPPNPWGLFDVHGNVWEWCKDAWRQNLTDPTSETDEKSFVARGGSWYTPEGGCRSAYRRKRLRRLRLDRQGFRFVLRHPGQSLR